MKQLVDIDGGPFRRLVVFSFAFLLLASSVHGTTYLVDDDRALIAASHGIVVGTVIDTHARKATNGVIETVSTIRIDERIKGVAEGATVSVVHPGGRVGREWMLVPGSPRYARGERVLLFLDRNARGDWTTHALALGSFRFENDADGNAMLNRTGEITGWDAPPQSSIHVERPRRAEPFLDYVRAIARGEESHAPADFIAQESSAIAPNAAFTGGSYTLRIDETNTTPVRRFGSELSMSWRLSGTQGGLDFVEAVDFGVEKWNAQSPLLNDERSPTPASGDTLEEDSETRIIAGDPHNEVPGSCCSGGGIIASAYMSGTADDTAVFNGETFVRITHSDIIVNDGVSVANLGQARFDTTMAHELGHTLGLRHGDRNTFDNATCAAPLECCRSGCNAIMKSSIGPALTSLQPWDRSAVDCLYDAVCSETTSCVPPSIANQPPDRTIVSGATTSLSVVATGTSPFSYQWFIGKAGDTSVPTGGSSTTLSGLSPAVTTSYWVRVAGQCAPDANSKTATITVCVPPSIVTQPAATRQIRSGQTVSLSVAAAGSAPLTFAWFQGEVGDVSTPVGTNAAELTSVALFGPAKFWVRVSNGCGSVNSGSSTILILPGKRRAVISAGLHGNLHHRATESTEEGRRACHCFSPSPLCALCGSVVKVSVQVT